MTGSLLTLPLAGAHAAEAGLVLAQQAETPPPDSTAPAEPTAPTTATVTVTVDNVSVGEGNVWVAICDSGLSIEGCPSQQKVPAASDPVTVTFENVPPGTYAIAGYQDLNGNDQFDKLLGVPREPYALSGAAADMLVPTFKAAALTFAAGDDPVTIRLKRIGE
jgi:uncharacterized protein (DUF2141 family)